MNWTLRKSDQAVDDLTGIWDYIAGDNPVAAEKLVRDLLTLFDKTAGYPQLGRAVDDIGEGVRILTRGNYLLIYRLIESETTVELVRVIHGARDWQTLFNT
jgi:toxin ParE1/3/4